MSMKHNFLKNILSEDGATDGGFYFGDKTEPSKADVVVVSAPWSVTADFGRGATYTPDAIIDASTGGDCYDVATGVSIVGRVATAEIDYNIQEMSEHLGREAERITHHSSVVGEYVARKVAHINEGFAEMQAAVDKQTKHWAAKGKRIAVVGGYH
jgi:agmatinase